MIDSSSLVGAQRGLNAFRHTLVGKVALPLLLRGGEEAVDQVVEVALRYPYIGIGDGRAGQLREGAQEGVEMVDGMGEAGQDHVLLRAIVWRLQVGQKALQPAQVGAAPRLFRIPR